MTLVEEMRIVLIVAETIAVVEVAKWAYKLIRDRGNWNFRRDNAVE